MTKLLPTWLRKRLLPHRASVMLLVSQVITLAAVPAFILLKPLDLALWRVFCTTLALSIIFLLHFFWSDIDERLGEARGSLLVLLSSGTLVVGALWAGRDTPFLGNVLFLLVAEAMVVLSLRAATVYSFTLIGNWSIFIIAWQEPGQNMLTTLSSLALGIFFVAMFGLAIRAYSAQTIRAETLHTQLLAAREREKDLAIAEERVRLAREIHDGLGHHLAVLHVQLQAAAKLLERDPARAAQSIAVCREEAQAALNEVRQSVATMRQTPLDGHSLEEALQKLVGDFDARSSLTARFEQHGDAVPLAPAARMTLYRAAQEGLTNTQKHAAAQHVTVILAYKQTGVRLVVRDDGTGNGNSDRGDGFGLVGLRERAEQLGGTLAASFQAEQGFLLEMVLPVQAVAPQPVQPGPEEDQHVRYAS